MKFEKNNDTYVIRFEKGEEVIETLWGFCKEKGIEGGFFYGIGAGTDIELALFNAEAKEYFSKKFTGSLFEIANISGNVTKEKVHVHMTIADQENNAYAGHLVRAVIDPTLEVYLSTLPPITRKKDADSGLELMDL